MLPVLSTGVIILVNILQKNKQGLCNMSCCLKNQKNQIVTTNLPYLSSSGMETPESWEDQQSLCSGIIRVVTSAVVFNLHSALNTVKPNSSFATQGERKLYYRDCSSSFRNGRLTWGEGNYNISLHSKVYECVVGPVLHKLLIMWKFQNCLERSF